MALLCNDISHWLGANLESALNVEVISFWGVMAKYNMTSRIKMCQVITKWRDSLMNIKSIYKIKSKYEINHLKSYAMAISSAYVYTYNQYLDKHHDIAIQRNLTCQLPFNIQSLPISNKQWRLTLMTYKNITAYFLLEKNMNFHNLTFQDLFPCRLSNLPSKNTKAGQPHTVNIMRDGGLAPCVAKASSAMALA